MLPVHEHFLVPLQETAPVGAQQLEVLGCCPVTVVAALLYCFHSLAHQICGMGGLLPC